MAAPTRTPRSKWIEEGLRALPGLGPYTAAAVAAIAFDRPANVVDGNVERVMARLFAVDAPPVVHKDVADLAPQDEEDESAVPLYEGKSLWTARVNARSTVRIGDRIELAVDTRNLHFFDPDSGLAIGGTK